MGSRKEGMRRRMRIKGRRRTRRVEDLPNLEGVHRQLGQLRRVTSVVAVLRDLLCVAVDTGDADTLRKAVDAEDVAERTLVGGLARSKVR